MRLVTFQLPVFPTIQGEGILVGTPSTFVRLYGCDYSCSWCDTKGSWELGTHGDDFRPQEVAEVVLSHSNKHVVITGGNPLLQPISVLALIRHLRAGGIEHITIETQGSIQHRDVFENVDLISLSPKLHAPKEDWDTALDIIRTAWMTHEDSQAQVKVVTSTQEDVKEALRRFETMAVGLTHTDRGYVHFIIQPESSVGRRGIEDAMKVLAEWKWREDLEGGRRHVRIMPQLHKQALRVI